MSDMSNDLINELRSAIVSRDKDLGLLSRALLEAEDALDGEREAHKKTHCELLSAQDSVRKFEEIISSTSWRITAPLRWMAGKLRH